MCQLATTYGWAGAGRRAACSTHAAALLPSPSPACHTSPRTNNRPSPLALLWQRAACRQQQLVEVVQQLVRAASADAVRLQQLHHVLVQQEHAHSKLSALPPPPTVQWVLGGMQPCGSCGLAGAGFRPAKQRALGGAGRQRPAWAGYTIMSGKEKTSKAGNCRCNGAVGRKKVEERSTWLLFASGHEQAVATEWRPARCLQHTVFCTHYACCALSLLLARSPGADGRRAIQDAGLGPQEAQRIAQRHVQVHGQPAGSAAAQQQRSATQAFGGTEAQLQGMVATMMGNCSAQVLQARHCPHMQQAEHPMPS